MVSMVLEGFRVPPKTELSQAVQLLNGTALNLESSPKGLLLPAAAPVRAPSKRAHRLRLLHGLGLAFRFRGGERYYGGLNNYQSYFGGFLTINIA